MLPSYIGPKVVLLVLFTKAKLGGKILNFFHRLNSHTLYCSKMHGPDNIFFCLPRSIFYKLHSEPVSYTLTAPKEELQDLAKVTSGKIIKVRDDCPRQSIQKIAQIIIVLFHDELQHLRTSCNSYLLLAFCALSIIHHQTQHKNI